MQNQLRHFESHSQVEQLAAQLHSYALNKLTQYFLIIDSQLQDRLIKKSQRRSLLQRHGIVQTLCEMLKNKDLVYFTKETLMLISAEQQ